MAVELYLRLLRCPSKAFTLRDIYKPDFPQDKAICVRGNGFCASVSVHTTSRGSVLPRGLVYEGFQGIPGFQSHLVLTPPTTPLCNTALKKEKPLFIWQRKQPRTGGCVAQGGSSWAASGEVRVSGNEALPCRAPPLENWSSRSARGELALVWVWKQEAS